jgi:hypothetical protein
LDTNQSQSSGGLNDGWMLVTCAYEYTPAQQQQQPATSHLLVFWIQDFPTHKSEEISIASPIPDLNQGFFKTYKS